MKFKEGIKIKIKIKKSKRMFASLCVAYLIKLIKEWGLQVRPHVVGERAFSRKKKTEEKR